MEVLVKKREALSYYLESLLRGRLKDKIAAVYLFGSMAQGRAVQESDVDLLIFGAGELEQIADLCAELQLETYCRYSESVEALVYPLEAMRTPSYFLYRVIHRGEEVYRMDEGELKRQEARNLLNLAEEYLEGAREILAAKRFRIVCDTAYNAVELCIKGLLLLEMDELPKTHGGIIGEFGRHYVQSGKVAKELGRRLNRGLELRNKARYDFNIRVSREEAEGMLGLAEEMAQLLETRLG